MDLKLKDVADLLNVSETTIRRWLVEGKIPAYRINHQYRFNRTEIESWVMSQKLGTERGFLPSNEKPMADHKKSEVTMKGGSQQYSLYRAVYKGGVYHDIPGKTPQEVIPNTMKQLAPALGLDCDVLTDILLDRERLQSTALANGIAVPHPRDFLLNLHQDVVGVAFLKEPIPYDALDSQPVHTLFCLFACHDKRHLHLLAKIAHLSSLPETVTFLKSRPTKEKLLEYIKEWESKIHSE